LGRCGSLKQWRHGCRAEGSQDHIRRQCGEFKRMFANLLGVGRCPAGIDLHVQVIECSGGAQSFRCSEARRPLGRSRRERSGKRFR
jgi:hypothetical protein